MYWSYTRGRVLTLERLDGIQLADIDPDSITMAERGQLAEVVAEAWMTMVFRHGFFHGDPHPANVLVMPEGDGIGLVDFGAIGKLTDDDMSRLTRLFLDAVNENIDALPRRLRDLGVRYPREREDEFVEELRELFYRYYGASLVEIDPLQVIREAFGSSTRSTSSCRRGSCCSTAWSRHWLRRGRAHPDFNVFEIARLYARELMLRRFAPNRLATDARREAWQLAGIVREMPYQVHDLAEELRDGQMEAWVQAQGPRRPARQARHPHQPARPLDRCHRRLARLVHPGRVRQGRAGVPGGQHVGVIGFAGAAALGIWLFVGILRSGRV